MKTQMCIHCENQFIPTPQKQGRINECPKCLYLRSFPERSTYSTETDLAAEKFFTAFKKSVSSMKKVLIRDFKFTSEEAERRAVTIVFEVFKSNDVTVESVRKRMK